MRYAQAQFQLVKCASRRGHRRAARSNFSTHRQGRHGARLRRGRQPADAVFRAGPRDAEARRVRLREIRQEGAVFRSSIQHQLATSQAMQDTVTSRELFERMPTRPALAEVHRPDQWTSSFVLLFPARPHVGRAGPRAPRPSGSERSSSSRPSCSPCTVQVTPTSSSYPACRFLSPQRS